MVLVDWRRLLLALPLLAGVGAALYVLVWRGGAPSTPRPTLLDTPAPAEAPVGTRKGQVARDFVAVSPEGEVVRLSELRGAPTVINFWATWCTSCLAELPDLKAVQAEIGPENLRVLAINVGEAAGRAKEFLEALDAPSFYVGMDPTLVVSDTYGVRGMPQSVFVDSEGFIRATYVGQLDKELMREYVQAASLGSTAGEPPHKLRLVTTVPRDHVLEVHRLNDSRVEFRSKSLRCDDSYCAAPAIDALGATEGVISVERYLGEDPPRIVVAFDGNAVGVDALVGVLVAALEKNKDPLYERPIEVRYP